MRRRIAVHILFPLPLTNRLNDIPQFPVRASPPREYNRTGEYKQMTSELKSATARANGAKSRGPKTAETRERSSRNSLRHGIVARKTILLECEDPDQFQAMLDEYAVTYQPGNAIEQDLVDEML